MRRIDRSMRHRAPRFARALLFTTLAAGSIAATGSMAVAQSQAAGQSAAVEQARAAAGNPSGAKTGTPFVLEVERMVPLEAPEWETMELKSLEVRMFNAPTDEARQALAAQADALRQRIDQQSPCVLLGRSAAKSGSAAPTAVLVPAGMSGRTAVTGSVVRVTPSTEPWPNFGLGEAGRAFPELRLFGTATRPGFVASAIEVTAQSGNAASEPRSTAEAVKAIPTAEPSPWLRKTPASLAASASLVVEGAPVAGSPIGNMVPMSLRVRNSAVTSLPPCHVYFEFFDGSGNLIHREFRWLTERMTDPTEARIPEMAPNAVITLDTMVPVSVAPMVSSAKVLIVRALPRVAK